MAMQSPMFTRSTIQPSQQIITAEVVSTSPTLLLTDSSSGEDDWRVRSDADDFYIDQNVGDASWTNRLKFTAGSTHWTVGGSYMDFPVGSAAAPSISFTGATTTGLYGEVAYGKIGFTSAGVALLRMYSSSGDTVIWGDQAAGKGLYIQGQVTDGLISIATGPGSTSGANIIAYGSTHATLANKWAVRQGSTDALTVTGTQLVTIGASGGTQTHVVNGGANITRPIRIGGTPATSVPCYVTYAPAGEADVAAFASGMAGASGSTSTIAGFSSSTTTAAAAFTCALLYHFNANNATKGAGSTITRNIAYYGTMPTQGSTANVFLGDAGAASASGNFGIYLATTNPSVLSGPLGVGGANSSSAILQLGATNPLTSTNEYACVATFRGSSSALTSIMGFNSNVSTADAAYTCPIVRSFYAANRTKGAASTITRQVQFQGDMPTQAGTSNIILGDIGAETATGNYGIYLATTNANYVAGKMTAAGGVATKSVAANISDPPTDAELDAAFGEPATVGDGFIGVITDNSGGTKSYVVWAHGTTWEYAVGAVAA